MQRLEDLGSPDEGTVTDQVVSRSYRSEEVLAALEGRFTVLGHECVLAPPIDWTQDPVGSRSWRYHLHTLQFLGPLLQPGSEHDRRATLGAALTIGLDWIQSNPRGGSGVSEFAWYDMAVGSRAGIGAYLLRAAAAERLLTASGAEEMVEALREHGAFLADDDNYAQGHNHGLFVDEGLLLLTERLPFLPEAPDWQAKASSRLIGTLSETISAVDGVHLEHSPAYHFVILNMLRRLSRRPSLTHPELKRLLDGVEDAAPWLVAPDGTLPEVGDSDPTPVPRRASEAAATRSGMRAFLDAGYAAIRDGGSYLLVSAGYHSVAHKHADELSFVLHENGVRVVGDTGRYGYYETEPGRVHARSSSAHNVLMLDGEFTWRRKPAYGSGLAWAEAHSGWYAVEGVNPLLARLEAHHRRTFLYKPTVALVVVDEVESAERRTHTRLVHFGAGVELRPGGETVEISAEGVRGHLSDWSSAPTRKRVVLGQTEPTLQGWTFPSDRLWTEAPTLELEAEAGSATHVMTLSFGDGPALVRRAETSDTGTLVELEIGGSGVELECTRSPGGLTVHPR